MANLWRRRNLIPAALRDSEERSRIWLRAREQKLWDFVSPKHMALLAQMCADDPPDVVLVEYVHLSYLVDAIPKNPTKRVYKLIDTHDLMHERQRRFHAMGELHHLDITPAEEAAALRKFDAILAIQQREAEKFRELVPGHRIVVVGMTEEITPLPVREAKEVRLAFFGSDMPPNRHAVEILLNIWPRLQARFAEDVLLDIYGTVCERFRTIAMPPGVTLKGFVHDLQQAYRETDIVLNPVFFGGGLKLKSVEALCHSRPLVTTPVGAEGLEDGSGWAFLVCDTPEEIGRVVEWLVHDSSARRRLAEAAHTYALMHFTAKAVYSPLDRLLKEWGFGFTADEVAHEV
jgi:glycosyltransferase involved in cell wall biosynthesis